MTARSRCAPRAATRPPCTSTRRAGAPACARQARLDLSSSLAAALRDGAVEGVEIARAPTPDWDRRPRPAGDGNALPARLAPADRAVLPLCDDDDEAPPAERAEAADRHARALRRRRDDEAGVSRLVAALEEDGADADLSRRAPRLPPPRRFVQCRRVRMLRGRGDAACEPRDGEPLDHGDVSPAWQTPGPSPSSRTRREGACSTKHHAQRRAGARHLRARWRRRRGRQPPPPPPSPRRARPDLPSEGTALWPPTLPGASGAVARVCRTRPSAAVAARAVTKSVGGASDSGGIGPRPTSVATRGCNARRKSWHSSRASDAQGHSRRPCRCAATGRRVARRRRGGR